ncbi:MAG: chemotaxis protein CheX [Thiovulaceae bacterium]|nr:chemotaxis protein CheX [Sulfurimonadaceae bacterium]
MIDVLAKATENFITHQLRETSNKDKKNCLDEKHQSRIDLITSGTKKEAYFYYTHKFIQTVSEVMLGEETQDADALTDLINETTNMIAGSAKIVASESDASNFDIGIPTYDGVCEPKNDGTFYAFYINNELVLQIGVKD